MSIHPLLSYYSDQYTLSSDTYALTTTLPDYALQLLQPLTPSDSELFVPDISLQAQHYTLYYNTAAACPPSAPVHPLYRLLNNCGCHYLTPAQPSTPNTSLTTVLASSKPLIHQGLINIQTALQQITTYAKRTHLQFVKVHPIKNTAEFVLFFEHLPSGCLLGLQLSFNELNCSNGKYPPFLVQINLKTPQYTGSLPSHYLANTPPKPRTDHTPTLPLHAILQELSSLLEQAQHQSFMC